MAEAPKFEEGLAGLEKLVDELENGDLGLDEALKRFEKGVKLTAQLQGALEGAQRKVEKLAQDVGAKVDLEVLLVGEGGDVKLGAPLVEGARVEAEVVSHGKHKKLWHFRTQEEGWDRIRGHRQPYTEIRITGITG